METKSLSGIWPVIPTPLTPDEKIDKPSLRQIIRYTLNAGVHGLWLLGAGAELPNLSLNSIRTVMEVAIDEAKGKVPIICGVGDCSVRGALEKVRLAEEIGADAIHSVEPYYYPLRITELVSYFEALANESNLPLVIYVHPGRWPANSFQPEMLQDTVGRLASHPSIIGIKHSVVDFRDFQRLVFAYCSESFRILTSAGRLLLPSLVIGAAGGVFHEATVAPQLYVELYNLVAKGDLERALKLQQRLARLGDAMSLCDHAAGKVALQALGLCSDTMTKPLHTMQGEHRRVLVEVMRDLHLL